MTQRPVAMPDFERGRVIVVGDVMLDRYWHGDSTRISPEAPVPVVHVRDIEKRPGGAANVAMNLAALHVRALLFGLVGDDEAGDALAALLDASGVEQRLSRLAAAHTVTKMRVLSRHQQLIRLDIEEDFPALAAETLTEPFKEALGECDAVVFSDYGKGALSCAATLIDAARERGVPVLVDPKGRDFSRYRRASVLTPNLAEFEAVVGHCDSLQTLEQRARAVCEREGIDALLVTRGEDGMSLVPSDAEPLHQPAQAREVYDVTGAGDTVIAVLAAALAAGSPLAEAVVLANVAAGVVVGKLGTATLSSRELRDALHPPEPSTGAVVEREALAPLLAAARARGERIVMTNGCFDILHAGHVQYLAAARELGDRLLVAVNDDASVRALKGEARPYTPLAERQQVLAALRCVDWVTSFPEPTPAALIASVSPDVLVKGGDYREEDIAGAAHVRACGGEVRVLPFRQGCSTSALVRTIRTRGGAR